MGDLVVIGSISLAKAFVSLIWTTRGLYRNPA